MGRIRKNNCDYFPHLTTMRNHRKVKALRNKFGAVLGYAFWSMFLEYLTELDGNEFEFSDIECEMFAAELGISATEIKEMINYCIEIELLFIKNNFIFSHSLNDQLLPVYTKREKAKEVSATQKRRKDGTFGISVTEMPEPTDKSVTETPQSIVEHSKEEYIYADFLSQFNRITKRGFRGDGKSERQFRARLSEGYKRVDFEEAISNCLKDPYHQQNPRFLTPEFITRADKLQKYFLPEFKKDEVKTVTHSQMFPNV